MIPVDYKKKAEEAVALAKKLAQKQPTKKPVYH